MIDREVTVCSLGDCANASFGLFEPALVLGVDEPPALFDEFAPSVALGERDGELGFKLFVNRFVVESGPTILLQRERIKRQTITARRLQHQRQAA
jgi:hypothetical protein